MKRLYRSKKHRLLGGILGGIGEYLNVDPSVIRLIFLVLLVMTTFVPLTILYLIALWIIPEGYSDWDD